MKTLTRNRRGAATVELAVLMIVLIPSIMYTLFLEDLLFYKFDLEEAVTSTPWDATNMDYRKDSTADIVGSWSPPGTEKPTSKGVAGAGRKTYADHTSAWNTYGNWKFDGDNQKHHQAVAAHQCWLAEGGQQLECAMDEKVGLLVEPTFVKKNTGGLLSCDAILGVQNYFLPQQFFQWWGKVSISGGGQHAMKRHTTGNDPTKTIDVQEIHGQAKSDPYVYPKMTFGVLHDSWALYKTEEIDPTMHPEDQFTEFSSWVRIPYGLRAQKLKDANQFAQDAIDKEILGSTVKLDGFGDMLITPPLAWKPDPKRKFSNHYSSAWSDQRHQNTQSKLQDKYMGLPDNTW